MRVLRMGAPSSSYKQPHSYKVSTKSKKNSDLEDKPFSYFLAKQMERSDD